MSVKFGVLCCKLQNSPFGIIVNSKELLQICSEFHPGGFPLWMGFWIYNKSRYIDDIILLEFTATSESVTHSNSLEAYIGSLSYVKP